MVGGRRKPSLASGVAPAAPTDANSSGIGSNLGAIGGAAGIYSGLRQGGPAGYASAGVNATQLGSKLGAFGDASKTIGTYAGAAGNALGIYSGLRRGGVVGYGGAAGNAAQLAGTALGSGALNVAGGAILAPINLYNEVKNWQSGNTTSDALAGATTGASIGTVILPGIGTVVGGLIGGAAGALSSAFGPGKTDPETTDWNSYLTASQKIPGLAAQVQNPYLLMAGLFDERSSTLPFYQKYGRMGEQKFTNDFAAQINNAVRNGTISRSDNPQTIYNKVVSPWVNSMGSGWSKVGPQYTQAAQGLLQQMTQQYVTGQAQSNWKAVGGDNPFKNLTPFGG